MYQNAWKNGKKIRRYGVDGKLFRGIKSFIGSREIVRINGKLRKWFDIKGCEKGLRYVSVVI